MQVSIDEFISYLTQGQGNLTASSQSTLDKIRVGDSFNVKSLFEGVGVVPNSYQKSFTTTRWRDHKNLPSCVFRAHVDPTTMLWRDLPDSMSHPGKLGTIDVDVGGMFTLISAEGIKAPQGADFDKEKIVRNSVRFSLLDKSTGNLIFNTAVVIAKWDKANDDIWSFPDA